jgi:hypothetical protein
MLHDFRVGHAFGNNLVHSDHIRLFDAYAGLTKGCDKAQE